MPSLVVTEIRVSSISARAIVLPTIESKIICACMNSAVRRDSGSISIEPKSASSLFKIMFSRRPEDRPSPPGEGLGRCTFSK